MALLFGGVGVASADPQGQVGTADDPLEKLHTEELNGGVTGDQAVTDLLGTGLSVDAGMLDASGASSWAEADADDLLEPKGTLTGIDVADVRTDGLDGAVTGGTELTDLAGNGLTIGGGSLGISPGGVDSAELANDSVIVAGNTVSLGGSTTIAHSELTGIGGDDHHARPSAGVGLTEDSDDFAVEPAEFAGRNLVASEGTLDYDPPENVVVVAKSGGDYTDVGAALDAVSGPGVVWVAPGEYDVSETSNDIPAGVSLVGASKEATTLYNDSLTGMGIANSAEIRSLTIEQRGGAESGIESVVEMNESLEELRLQDVHIRDTETEEHTGILILEGEVLLHNVTVRMNNFGTSTGVFVADDGYLTARDSVLVGGSGSEGYGLNVSGDADVANTQLENGVKLATGGTLNEVGTYDGDYNAR